MKPKGNRQSTRDRDRYQRQTITHVRQRARQRAVLTAGQITEHIKMKWAEKIGKAKWGRDLYRINQGEGFPFVYGVWCSRRYVLITVLTHRMVKSRRGITLDNRVELRKFPEAESERSSGNFFL